MAKNQRQMTKEELEKFKRELQGEKQEEITEYGFYISVEKTAPNSALWVVVKLHVKDGMYRDWET